MQQSFKDIAQRMINAQNEFVAWVSDTADVNEDDALNILAIYRKHRLVKLDIGIGRYNLIHGALAEKRVLLNALKEFNR